MSEKNYRHEFGDSFVLFYTQDIICLNLETMIQFCVFFLIAYIPHTNSIIYTLRESFWYFKLKKDVGTYLYERNGLLHFAKTIILNGFFRCSETNIKWV